MPLAAARAQVEAVWSSSVGGYWDDGANWSSNPDYPNNDGGVTYNATIDLVADPYFVVLDTDVTVDNFTLDSSSATVIQNAGTFSVLDEVNLLSGTYRIGGARILGGIWNVAPGTFDVSNSEDNVLDGVTFNGDLELTSYNDKLRIANGLNINGAVNLSGEKARLTFEGNQVLDNTSVNFASTSWTYRQYLSVAEGGSLTLGPNVVVQGNRGEIDGEGTLVNQGRISAGTQLTIAPQTFVNEGTIEALDSKLTIGGNWSNLGTITAVDSTVELGGTFTTAGIGTLNRTGGDIRITGLLDNAGDTFTLDATTGSWKLYGGTIHGGTLNFEDGAELTYVASNVGRYNYLDDVTINGPLAVTAGKVRLSAGTTYEGDLSLGGGAAVGFDVGQTLDNQTIALGTADYINTISAEGAGTLTLGPNMHIHGCGRIRDAQFIYEHATIVNQGLISANVDDEMLSIWPAVFINEGTLTATNGSTLQIGGPEKVTTWTNTASGTITADHAKLDLWGDWTNEGVINITDSTMYMRGEFTTADLGTINRSGGSVHLCGTLDNTDDTLDLDAATGQWNLWDGTIRGGTVRISEGGGLMCGWYGSGSVPRCYLEDVAIDGDLVLTAGTGSAGTLCVNVGTTVSGDIEVHDGIDLLMDVGRTLDDKNVVLAEGDLYLTGEGTLTFGPNLTLTAQDGRIAGDTPTPFVNQGSMLVESENNELTVEAAFTNEGLMRAQNGATLTVGHFGTSEGLPWTNTATGRIEAADSWLKFYDDWENHGTISASNSTVKINRNPVTDDSFLNTGVIDVTDSTLELHGLWDNDGVINATDSIVNLAGTFSTPDVGTINRTGGQVNVVGTLDNTGHTLDLNESTGSWKMVGGTITGGMITRSGGSRLEFSNETLSTLRGVSFGDDLLVDGHVLATGGIDVAGDIRLELGAQFVLPALQTFDDNTVVLDGGKLMVSGPLGTEMVLGPDFLVHGGTGEIGYYSSSTATVINQGTISADLGGTFRVQPAHFVNEGTVEATNHAMMMVGDTYGLSSLTNNGRFTASGGAILQIRNPAILTNLVDGTLTGGLWEVEQYSTMDFQSYSIDTNAAEIVLSGLSSTFSALQGLDDNQGSLTVTDGRDFCTAGDLFNHGHLHIGEGSTFTVSGVFESDESALLGITLGGPVPGDDFGQLVVSYSAVLDGILSVSLSSGYCPGLGDSFEFLTASSITGVFDGYDFPALPGGLSFHVNYGVGSVTLGVVPEPTALVLMALGTLALRRRRTGSPSSRRLAR